jgi:hypothetical protein
MSDTTKKADYSSAIIEFYRAARDELVERIKLRDQVLLIYLAFVGAVTGAAFSVGHSREIALVLPFLGLGCAILVSQHNSVIGAIIRYTSVELSEYLIPHELSIPEFVNSNSFRKHSPRSNFLRSVGHGVVILVPEIIGLAINYNHAIFSPFPFGPAWWFGAVCVIISFIIILVIHSGRQKVYAETPWIPS